MFPYLIELGARDSSRKGEESGFQAKRGQKSDGGTTKACERNAGEDVNNGSTQKRVRMRGARVVLGGGQATETCVVELHLPGLRGGTSLAGGSAGPARASSSTTAATARTSCAAAVPSGATGILGAVTSRASGAEASTIRTTHSASAALRDRPLVVRFALDYVDAVLHAALGGDEDRAFAAFGRAHRHLDRFARMVQLFKLDERACFLQSWKDLLLVIAITARRKRLYARCERCRVL